MQAATQSLSLLLQTCGPGPALSSTRHKASLPFQASTCSKSTTQWCARSGALLCPAACLQSCGSCCLTVWRQMPGHARLPCKRCRCVSEPGVKQLAHAAGTVPQSLFACGRRLALPGTVAAAQLSSWTLLPLATDFRHCVKPLRRPLTAAWLQPLAG